MILFLNLKSIERFFMLQKEIRTAINEAKMKDEGIFLNYQYDFSSVKEVLMQHPELIDSQDEEGNTLLHHLVDPKAVVNGLNLKEVLQYNPIPYVKNKEGLTPRLVLLSDEACFDKNYEQDVLSAYEQSYMSTQTAEIFKGIVLLMNKIEEGEKSDDQYVSYQENMTLSILNLFGAGNQKLAYMQEQNKAGNNRLSVIKRKILLEKTLSKF